MKFITYLYNYLLSKVFIEAFITEHHFIIPEILALSFVIFKLLFENHQFRVKIFILKFHVTKNLSLKHL